MGEGGWVFRGENTGRVTPIIALPGSGGTGKTEIIRTLDRLLAAGEELDTLPTVYSIDYTNFVPATRKGFGLTVNQTTIINDAKRLVMHVLDRRLSIHQHDSERDVTIMAHSLGCAVAIQTLAQLIEEDH